MKLSFHGADQGVTGSCHLLECLGRRILVDCGLFQGGRRIEEENVADFGFDPAEIDFVLLTHAHLDHCGRLPLLVKRGFRGEIIATSATRDLARLVLLDAAHLQAEEARYRARKSQRRAARGDEEGPLYSLLDTMDTFDRFGRNAEYGRTIDLGHGITVTFLDAGHILGSASVLVECVEKGRKRRLLFSGDIGGSGRPLLRDPQNVSDVDAVVMETTYGDRSHRPLPASREEFREALAATFQRGGNVVVPTFALERAQELLFYLREDLQASRLPPAMQVFLDSPMAISATEIFRRHPECYDGETSGLLRSGIDPFDLPRLHFTRETAESIAINAIRGGALIMAGSGMCTGGRVRHHLRHNLSRPECAVVFVGFASSGTLARRIIDGAREVDISGETVPVRARIHTINGFSAHAGQQELLAWQQRTQSPLTILTHGEEEAMKSFADKLKGTRVFMPKLGEAIEI